MLNDSSDGEAILSKLKRDLTELFNTDKLMIDQYRELFDGAEPSAKVKELMEKIGRPREKMKEIYTIIKQMTNEMKEELDERD